jgi:flavin-binding protein dodecin
MFDKAAWHLPGIVAARAASRECPPSDLPNRAINAYSRMGLSAHQCACPSVLLQCKRRMSMAESVYKIIEIVGTSPTSWEKAAAAAVERASQTLRDLRIAEVCQQDVSISDGKVESYRVRLKVSFKFED